MSKKNSHSPLVSISCITYNHAPYIRDCLEGFLMQKTDFPFEILIHDDASTDGTADIIREYQKKYPDIIKPILREKNLYSQGVRMMNQFNYERAKGKYIAFCEGDDYWNDSNKLQIQYDFMESHEDCALCYHGMYILNHLKKFYIRENFPNKSILKHESNISFEILALNSNIRTPSVFFRKEIYNFCHDTLMRDCQNMLFSDLQLFFHLSLNGKVEFIPRYMATYRIRPGSCSCHEQRNRDELTKGIDAAIDQIAINNGYEKWVPELQCRRNSVPPARLFTIVRKFNQRIIQNGYLRYFIYCLLPIKKRIRIYM